MSTSFVSPTDSGSISTYKEPTASTDPGLGDDIMSALDGDAGDADDSPEITEESIPEAPATDVFADGEAEEETEAEGDEEPPAEGTVEASGESTEPKVDAAAVPAVPEGVKVRNVDGKPRWVLDPEAGKQVFASAALAQKAAEIIGEPLTEAALEFRQRTVEGNERLRSDMLSDSPNDQGRVIAHFENMFNTARERGEIGHDAMAGFVKNAVGFGLTSKDPGTRTATAEFLLKTAIEDTYSQALSHPDADKAARLWAVAQNLEEASFGTFRKSELLSEGRKQAPPARFQRAAPPSVDAGRQQPADQTQQFEAWSSDTGTKIDKEAIDQAIDDAVSHIAPATREKHPVVFKSLRDQLKSTVREALLGDQSLRNQVDAASRRARLATNPDIRNQITSELVTRHLSRATEILKNKKGPILSEFAVLLAEKSNATKNRMAAGQQASRAVTSAGGPSASRTTRPAPKSGTFSSNKDFHKELDQAFA